MSCVLTLQLETEAQAYFEALRKKHYPEEKNQISAHLTLFHRLPESDELMEQIAATALANTTFQMQVTGLRSLGRGVAYTLASPVLMEIQRRLAQAFDEFLIAQDRQRFMPHIVVQNKVTAEQARTLLASLQSTFVPMTVEAAGLGLWEYLGGPWRHLRMFPFTKMH